MKDKIITFDKEQMKELADGYFHRICGAGIEGEQKEVFLEEINKAEQRVRRMMIPQAIFSYYGVSCDGQPVLPCGKVMLKQGKACFTDDAGGSRKNSGLKESLSVEFSGGIFKYYERPGIKGILPYLLTIGSLDKSEDMKLLEQYYMDAWGSAYVEAAHDLFKIQLVDLFNERNHWEEVEIQNECFISEPFGPGYFEIDVEDTAKLFRMLDYGKLKLTLSEGNMMQPEKSCSGFYVITEEAVPFPENNCAQCSASGNCEYCRKKNV